MAGAALCLGLLPEAAAADSLDWSVYARDPGDLGLTYQKLKISLPSRKDRLAAWYVPGHVDGAPREDRGPQVLVLPADVHPELSPDTMADRLELIGYLAERGYGVMTFDHRGHGASEGETARQLVSVPQVADAQAVLHVLLDREETDSTMVAVYGESMGAALGFALVGDRPIVRALVAVSAPYKMQSVVDVLQELRPDAGISYPEPWERRYDPDQVTRRMNVPLFLIVGDADRVTPIWMTRDLHRRYPRPKELWEVRGAGHREQPYQQGPEAFLNDVLRERVVAFLEEAFAQEPHRGWPHR